MKKHTDITNNLREELSNFQLEISQQNLYEHANFLSNLYLKTISRISPRIIINGDNKYLKENDNASMIRALLMSAIRSYILWEQSGGSKFRIFIFRKKIAKLAITL